MSTTTKAALDAALDAHLKAEAAEIRAEAQAEVAAVRAECAATVARIQAELDAHMATHQPPKPARELILGMSALPSTWDQRLAEVGADGIKARRIFCNFTANGRDKEALIRKAIADGMMPVLSYKGTPTPANVAAVRTFLDSLGVKVTATWHHEPHGDMTPAEFRDGSKAMLAAKTERVKVGPILNGWLLDRRVADWASYTSPELLDAWDFLGLDTYSEGTVANPSTTLLCGRAIPLAAKWLAEQGHPDMPLLIGEFNGQTEAAIAYAADQILATPQVWVACLWNVDHMQNGALKFNVLDGKRLEAFKRAKADPRVLR